MAARRDMSRPPSDVAARVIAAIPAIAFAVAIVVVAILRPWHDSAQAGELTVDRAALRSGSIVLVLANRSEADARIAQVIVNDAFVDFRASQRALGPGDAERILVSYPWVRGESYDVRLMMSSGATVEYEIEDAELS